MSKSAAMLKVGIVAALVGLGAAAQAQTGSCIITTKGKYCFIVDRWYLVTGSLECGWMVGHLPGTAQHPAMAECALAVRSVELVCENPTSHQVSPGEAATREVLVQTAPITSPDPLSKQNGTAPALVTFAQATLNETFGKPEYCVNPNWSPSAVYPDVLVRSLVATSTNYSCPDGAGTPSCVPCSTLQATCTLPATFNLEVARNGSQPNFPPRETAYECVIDGATSTGLCK